MSLSSVQKLMPQSSSGIQIVTRPARTPCRIVSNRSSLTQHLQPHRRIATVVAAGRTAPTSFGISCNRTASRTAEISRRSTIICQSASSAASGSESEGFGKTLVLGGLFAGWYLFNIYFNIYNKQVLSAFPFPLTCTTLQFAVGGVVAILAWITGVLKRPQVTPQMIMSILPLALVHCLGNLLTNCSLGAVAVSFTHTIKAMEPFFSVILSWFFLAERPHPLVLATLFPIVGGVAAASLAELSFNWTGFLAAMGSNVTFQSRNVLSKKLMVKKDGLDNINLFSIITVLAFFILLPFTLFVEGVKFTPSALQQLGITETGPLFQKAISAALCFHMYQQVSYMILSRVSPVTHSIGNCVKRVIVIVASVLVFQNPMTMQTAAGTGVALLGVFAYSQAKRLTKPKPT